jgi:hypothetical protein
VERAKGGGVSIPTEMRPHDAYIDCLDGGYRGYQARCWDCDWTGVEHLRGDEQMGTEASRAHKHNARLEAAEHAVTERIECCSKCRRALSEIAR